MENKVDWTVWHGSYGKEEWKLPECVARTTEMARKDVGGSIDASEYLDDENVLNQKMKIVADILRKVKFCTIYTGAGISRSAGIFDYGSKAKNSLTKEFKKLKNPVYAKPSYSHHALTQLEKEGLVKYWVQQNHDGLPQKAGFPQTKMNEIHGAWFDPSNPVVPMSGSLRRDLLDDLFEKQKKTELCLVMGTSLSGMTADCIASVPCSKFCDEPQEEDGYCYGSIIFNLQFTPLDKPGYCPIRIWARIDDAMKLLMKHLGIEVNPITKIPSIDSGDRIVCPYDEKGQYDSSARHVLDLSIGQYVVIVQPKAKNERWIGRVARKDEEGHYLISFRKKTRRMGTWWLKSLQEGRMKQMPLVNTVYGKENKDEEMEKEYEIMRTVPACKNCERIGKSLKLCRGCKTVYYCNQECQYKDWNNHKQECKRIGKQIKLSQK